MCHPSSWQLRDSPSPVTVSTTPMASDTNYMLSLQPQTCCLSSSPHKASSVLDTYTHTANATRPTRIQWPVNYPSLKLVHHASHQAGTQLNNVCLLNDSLATPTMIVNRKSLVISYLDNSQIITSTHFPWTPESYLYTSLFNISIGISNRQSKFNMPKTELLMPSPSKILRS